jgi:predicted GIY-YIG superfamily endonuclease
VGRDRGNIRIKHQNNQREREEEMGNIKKAMKKERLMRALIRIKKISITEQKD